MARSLNDLLCADVPLRIYSLIYNIKRRTDREPSVIVFHMNHKNQQIPVTSEQATAYTDPF